MLTRRRLLTTGAAALAWAPLGTVQAQATEPLTTLPPEFAPRIVRLNRPVPAGEIHVVPDEHKLYWTLPGGEAIRYFVGVARAGLWESGIFTVERKKEWPSWTPTPDMIEREPELYEQYADGMPGGPNNPLGARALYLFDDAGRDTFLRIHGTNRPDTIGRDVSNGCARLVNAQMVDLYDRVPLGTTVYLYEKNILPPIS